MSNNLAIEVPKLTAAGMRKTTNIRKYKEYGAIKEIFAEFSEKHPMRQKYGIKSMETYISDNGGSRYVISGDTFNGKRNFKFIVGKSTSAKPSEAVAKFFRDLAVSQKFNISNNMDSIISVAKYII